MSQEVPKTPGVFLAGFVGAALSSAWIAARPNEYISAVCIGTATCALLCIAQMLAFGASQSVDDESTAMLSRHASRLSRSGE